MAHEPGKTVGKFDVQRCTKSTAGLKHLNLHVLCYGLLWYINVYHIIISIVAEFWGMSHTQCPSGLMLLVNLWKNITIEKSSEFIIEQVMGHVFTKNHSKLFNSHWYPLIWSWIIMDILWSLLDNCCKKSVIQRYRDQQGGWHLQVPRPETFFLLASSAVVAMHQELVWKITLMEYSTGYSIIEYNIYIWWKNLLLLYDYMIINIYIYIEYSIPVT